MNIYNPLYNFSNPNGIYSKKKVDDQENIFWGLNKWGKKGNYIRSIQMLIKPKVNTSK